MNIYQFILTLFVIITALFFFGCSDDPSSVGKNLLPDIDNLQTGTSDLTAARTSNYSVKTSNNSTTLMVGRNVDVEAKMLLIFNIPVDTTVANYIKSAKISMFPNYSMKDTAGFLSFKMHKMINAWQEYSYTIDSLVPGSFEQTHFQSFSGNVNSKDSLFVINFDTSVVSGWLKNTSSNKGLIFIPDQSLNYIFGVSSYYNSVNDDGRPELEIVYQTPTDTVPKVFKIRAAQDATLFSGIAPASTNNLFFVQGGLIERGKVKFDVTSIPRSATVTQAVLELTADTLQSKFSYFADKKIIIHQIIKDDTIPELGGLTSTSDLVNGKYIVDVKKIVQQWLAAKPNEGFAIRSNTEFTKVERIALRGFNSANDKPTLRIKYTYIP